MATLTSTGVNCSNGTLDGQYTGTTATNTSFPIGSYLSLNDDYGYAPNNNAAVTPRVGYVSTAFTTASGTALAGTWRSRGRIGAGAYGDAYLIQRVA